MSETIGNIRLGLMGMVAAKSISEKGVKWWDIPGGLRWLKNFPVPVGLR